MPTYNNGSIKFQIFILSIGYYFSKLEISSKSSNWILLSFLPSYHVIQMHILAQVSFSSYNIITNNNYAH